VGLASDGQERETHQRAATKRRAFRRVPFGVAFRSRAERVRQQASTAIIEGPTPATRLWRTSLYRRSLAVADMTAAALAVVVTIPLLGEDVLEPTLLVVLPLVVLVGKVVGLYDRDEDLVNHTTLDEAPELFQTATLFTLVLWLAEDVLVRGELSPGQVVAFWVLLLVAMLACRTGARWVVCHSSVAERCIVLGDAETAERIRDKVEGSGSINAVVVGRAALQPADADNGPVQRLGDLERLPQILIDQRVERVIIAPSSADTEDLLDAIRVVKALGVKVTVLPRLFEALGSSVRFDHVEGLLLLGIPTHGLTTSSRLLKRAMDVSVAVLGFALLAPVLGAIALLIKLTSPGSVLFHQTRIGRHGQEFQMIKFRTMVRDADEYKAELLKHNESDGIFKIANDPRLTSVGKVLRRLSLDELPQLWNVLRGDMSLVGPRPLVPEEDSRVDGWRRRRLELPPGMTGTWQVLGSARIPLSEMVKIDYLYGANWSLWLDLKILLRTFLVFFHRSE
jgi:exopolysaccharide biosynthesis polyprenyl glycosylphosphotransferase